MATCRPPAGSHSASQSLPGCKAKFTGETTLGKFSAIEKANAEDILKCESLALHDLSVGYNPVFVQAKKVVLTDSSPTSSFNPGAAQPPGNR